MRGRAHTAAASSACGCRPWLQTCSAPSGASTMAADYGVMAADYNGTMAADYSVVAADLLGAEQRDQLQPLRLEQLLPLFLQLVEPLLAAVLHESPATAHARGQVARLQMCCHMCTCPCTHDDTRRRCIGTLQMVEHSHTVS